MLPALIEQQTGYDYLQDLDEVVYIDQMDEAEALVGVLLRLNEEGSPIALDYETTGVNPAEETPVNKGYITSIQLSWLEDGTPTRYFINVDSLPGFVEMLRPWLGDTKPTKVIHNFSFEGHITRNHGIKLEGLLADTLQLSRLENAERISHSLDGSIGLAHKILGIPHEMRPTTKRALSTHKYRSDGTLGAGVELRTMREIIRDDESLPYLMVYGTNDTCDTLLLFYEFVERLKKMPWQDQEDGMWDYYQQYHRPFQYVVLEMEREGFHIDSEWAQALEKKFEARVEELDRALWTWAGCSINWNSVPQKTWCLYGKKGEIQKITAKGIEIMGHGLPMPEIKPDANGPSTDKAALEWILDQLDPESEDALAIRNLQERAKLNTLLSGTLNRLLPGNPYLKEEGTVHCSYNISGARTGRMSCRNPNLQQVPSRSEEGGLIRDCFVSPPGSVVVCADYSQLELRILGYYLVTLFDDWQLANDLDSGDLHQITADRLSEILGYSVERAIAKSINFGIVYGISKYKISSQTGMSLDDAERLLDSYFQTYPGIKRYIDWATNSGYSSGCAKTLLGRYRPLNNIRGRDRKAVGTDKRRAMNTPIQGSAQDIVQLAMLGISENERLNEIGFVQRLQIHDEIVATCPAQHREEAGALMGGIMEDVLPPDLFPGIKLRADAHWGMTWAEAKEGELWASKI